MAEGEEKLEIQNPRAEMFAVIEAHNLDKIKKEIEEGGGDPQQLDATPPAEEAPAAEAIEEVPAAEAAAPETPAEEKPVEKTVKIKVDGKEQDVPESRVIELGIKTLQKETAADIRLDQANKAREEANRLLEHVKRNPEPSQDAPKVAVGEDVRALAHAIQYGSEEEATEALKKLKGNSGLTPDEAAAMIDERMSFRTAVDWYKRECKDIAEDPYLHQLFLVKEREKRQAGDQRPYLDLYGDITKEVRDWLGTKGVKPQADPLADKRERKATVVPHPKAASAKPLAPTETKEAKPSDVIADMRRARHQA